MQAKDKQIEEQLEATNKQKLIVALVSAEKDSLRTRLAAADALLQDLAAVSASSPSSSAEDASELTDAAPGASSSNSSQLVADIRALKSEFGATKQDLFRAKSEAGALAASLDAERAAGCVPEARVRACLV